MRLFLFKDDLMQLINNEIPWNNPKTKSVFSSGVLLHNVTLHVIQKSDIPPSVIISVVKTKDSCWPEAARSRPEHSEFTFWKRRQQRKKSCWCHQITSSTNIIQGENVYFITHYRNEEWSSTFSALLFDKLGSNYEHGLNSAGMFLLKVLQRGSSRRLNM